MSSLRHLTILILTLMLTVISAWLLTPMIGVVAAILVAWIVVFPTVLLVSLWLASLNDSPEPPTVEELLHYGTSAERFEAERAQL